MLKPLETLTDTLESPLRSAGRNHNWIDLCRLDHVLFLPQIFKLRAELKSRLQVSGSVPPHLSLVSSAGLRVPTLLRLS